MNQSEFFCRFHKSNEFFYKLESIYSKNNDKSSIFVHYIHIVSKIRPCLGKTHKTDNVAKYTA